MTRPWFTISLVTLAGVLLCLRADARENTAEKFTLRGRYAKGEVLRRRTLINKRLNLSMEFIKGRPKKVRAYSTKLTLYTDRVLGTDGFEKRFVERTVHYRKEKSFNGILKAKLRSSLMGTTFTIKGDLDQRAYAVKTGSPRKTDLHWMVLENYESAFCPTEPVRVGDTWTKGLREVNLIWAAEYREMTEGRAEIRLEKISTDEQGRRWARIAIDVDTSGIESEYGMRAHMRLKGYGRYSFRTGKIEYGRLEGPMEAAGKILGIPASGSGTISVDLSPFTDAQLAQALGKPRPRSAQGDETGAKTPDNPTPRDQRRED